MGKQNYNRKEETTKKACTNATRANVRKYKQAQKDLETRYLTEQQKYIQSQIDGIENASENSLH